MTLVKVCGLTRAEDVRLAVELGAWALGFVLTASPRRVTPGDAAALTALTVASGDLADGSDHRTRGAAGVPIDVAPLTVAVFTSEAADWVAAAAAAAHVDAVQLSAGAHGPTVTAIREATARLRRRPLVIAAADTPDARLADFMLLDARAPNAYGGTGRTLNWAALAADPSLQRDGLVLAGGLRPDNVGAAIRTLRPEVVDVSGGVEAAPGRKDERRLREFFAAVEHADDETEARTGARAAPPASSRRTDG